MNIREIFIGVTNLGEDWIDPIPSLLKDTLEGFAAFIALLLCLIAVITSPVWFVPRAIYLGVRDYNLSRNLDLIDSPLKARMALKPCIHREEITELGFYGKIVNHAIRIIAKDEDSTFADVWHKWYRSYKERR